MKITSSCPSLTHLLALGLLTCTLSLSAQQEDPPPPARIRFLFLEETPGRYSLKMGEDIRQLTAAPYAISPAITPPDLQELRVYKTGNKRDPETGEFPRVQVATLTPPNQSGTALVILRPDPNTPNGIPFQMEIIDSDPKSWPLGTIRILNRGRVNMAADIGGDMVTIRPNDQTILRANGDHRHRIRARIATQAPEGWKLIYDSIAIVRPEGRLTGLMVYSPSGLRFRFGEDLIEQRGAPPPSHVWLTYSDTP
jgi:hypothetical protein